jgi:Family of unknown function (DUF6356)
VIDRGGHELAMFSKLFTDHPRAIGETYGEHARTALRFGWRMVTGGLACMVHAVIPGLFVKTASRTVVQLDAEMRGRKPTPEAEEFAYVI